MSGRPTEAMAALGSGAVSPAVLLLELAVANAARATAGYLQRCQRAFPGGPCVELSVGAAMGAHAGYGRAELLLDAHRALERVDSAGAGGLLGTGQRSEFIALRTPEGVPVSVDAVVGGVAR